MDYTKEYKERVAHLPMSKLTIDDKIIIVKYNLSEAMSNFSTALEISKELDHTYVQQCLDDAKQMVYEAEDCGAEIGSFE